MEPTNPQTQPIQQPNQALMQNTVPPVQPQPEVVASHTLIQVNNGTKIRIGIGIVVLILLFIFGTLGVLTIRNSGNNTVLPSSRVEDQAKNTELTQKPVFNSSQPTGIAYFKIISKKQYNQPAAIWKADIDGSNPERVLEVKNLVRYHWLPGMNKIVFADVSYERENKTGTIKIYDIATQKVDVLYTHTREDFNIGLVSESNFDFIVSADNKYLVATEQFVERGAVLIDIASKKQTPIFQDLSVYDTKFSPDSKYLAVHAGQYKSATKTTVSDLYLFKMTDKSIQKTTNSPESQPDIPYLPIVVHFWAPDSSSIYFTDTSGSAFIKYDLMTKSAKNFNLEKRDLYGFWGISPDGNHIDGFNATLYGNNPSASLMKVDIQTGNQTDTSNFVEDDVIEYLSFSDAEWLYTPSGDKILFTAPEGSVFSIYSIPANMDNAEVSLFIEAAESPQWIY